MMNDLHKKLHKLSAAQPAYCAVNVNCVFTTSRAFNLKKDVRPSHQQSNLIYEFECQNCVSRYDGRTAHRLFSSIRQHVPLHLLPEDSSARADRPTLGELKRYPKRTIRFQKQPSVWLKKRCLKQMRRIPQPKERFPLAMANGKTLATADGVNPTLVGRTLRGG